MTFDPCLGLCVVACVLIVATAVVKIWTGKDLGILP